MPDVGAYTCNASGWSQGDAQPHRATARITYSPMRASHGGFALPLILNYNTNINQSRYHLQMCQTYSTLCTAIIVWYFLRRDPHKTSSEQHIIGDPTIPEQHIKGDPPALLLLRPTFWMFPTHLPLNASYCQ